MDGGDQHLVVCVRAYMAGGFAADRHAGPFQPVQVWAAHRVLDAVEQQRRLSVPGNDAAVLQEPQQLGELRRLVPGSWPCTEMTAG